MLIEQAECIDTLAGHFIDSAKAVFSSIVRSPLEVGELTRNASFGSKHELRGLIGLSGVLQATVVISLDAEIAFVAAKAFLGEKATTINADVLDLVGELSNMIAGGARERMKNPQIYLGLPTAIYGLDHHVFFESGAEVIQIPFRCEYGNMTIEYGVSRVGETDPHCGS